MRRNPDLLIKKVCQNKTYDSSTYEGMQVEVAETGLSHTGLYLLNRNAFVGLDFIPYQVKYIY